jgi:PIN domain nuclease of toxin-antitoxin system
MRLLLNTHVFLWFISADARLPQAVVDAIRDPGSEIYLSAVSVWEVSIKYRLGKLPLPQPPETYLPFQRNQHGITSLPLDESTITHLPALPDLHRDPFDRILLCQAAEYGLTVVTADDTLLAYPATFLRAK